MEDGPGATGVRRGGGTSRAQRTSQSQSQGPPRLTPEQERLIPDFLWHGAEAYGFRGDFWNCSRVGAVLKEEFGVGYTRSQVSRRLRRCEAALASVFEAHGFAEVIPPAIESAEVFAAALETLAWTLLACPFSGLPHADTQAATAATESCSQSGAFSSQAARRAR